MYSLFHFLSTLDFGLQILRKWAIEASKKKIRKSKMKLLFRQRMFSWLDSCDREVGTVKERVLTLLPKFEIYEIPRIVILKCDGSAISGNGTGWRRSRRGCSSRRTCRSIRRLVQSPRYGTDKYTEPHGTATWCSRR